MHPNVYTHSCLSTPVLELTQRYHPTPRTSYPDPRILPNKPIVTSIFGLTQPVRLVLGDINMFSLIKTKDLEPATWPDKALLQII